MLASAHFVHDHFIYGKNVHVAKWKKNHEIRCKNSPDSVRQSILLQSSDKW